MSETQNKKVYDLEERTRKFGIDVRVFIRKIKKQLEVYDDIKQLLRSSGSVGANYIEANESLSKKDFVNRIKICRKESKESIHWLKLLEPFIEDQILEKERRDLEGEATELVKIFNSIVQKSV